MGLEEEHQSVYLNGDVATDKSLSVSSEPRHSDVENNNVFELLDVPNAAPAPATRQWCTSPREHVQLRFVSDDEGVGLSEPRTLHTFLVDLVTRYGDCNVLGFKEKPSDSAFSFLTFKQYYTLICTVARAFIKMGLSEGGGVCIVGFNSVPWFVSNMAAIFAGGVSCGVYTTNTPDACRYVMEDCGCEIVVVENRAQLDKILQIRDHLPNLKRIIQWTPAEGKNALPEHGAEDVLLWSNVMEMGERETNNELLQRLRAQVPNQCSTLIYTSGTTGVPKGVMLSQDNITWSAEMICRKFRLIRGANHTIVSYLPLSHIAAQVADMYECAYLGGCTYFAQPDALRGSLRTTMLEVRPTIFLGVPRVFEKMQEKFEEVEAKVGYMKRSISYWAQWLGSMGQLADIQGTAKPYFWWLANRLFFSKVKASLGLDQAHTIISSAAPLGKDTLNFFMGLDLPILELYGASETCGPQTITSADQRRIGSVGKSGPGTQIRLEDQDPAGQGEVCMSGRNIFMGYLNSEEKTKEVLTDDGWLRSGDLGIVDHDGFLFITGRIKELIVTAGGENVAPIPIEERLKKELPCVSNAMVIGDKRKFLSVLLTFKCEANPQTTEPLDELAPVARDWCSSVSGHQFTTVSELRDAQSEEVFAKIHTALTQAIERVNEESVSRAARVQKYWILPRDFSIPGGELGPTLKLRRPVICQMYETEISALYSDNCDLLRLFQTYAKL